MAQLNPTVGELNKFAINGAGVSDNALVFGNDQNPIDSTYGFDSSTDQTGVTVFFSSKNIAQGKSTTLEVWLWNGSAWSKWTTINGNDADFSQLDATSVNFKWTMGGATYSKMYFNAKNLDTSMKLRVTGQEGQLVIDEDLTDGAYDQNYNTSDKEVVIADNTDAVESNVTELSSETSNREIIMSDLAIKLNDKETIALSNELSLETVIAGKLSDVSAMSVEISNNLNVEINSTFNQGISIEAEALEVLSTRFSENMSLEEATADAEDIKIQSKWYTKISKMEDRVSTERSIIRDSKQSVDRPGERTDGHLDVELGMGTNKVFDILETWESLDDAMSITLSQQIPSTNSTISALSTTIASVASNS